MPRRILPFAVALLLATPPAHADNIAPQTQTNGAIGNLYYDTTWQSSTYIGGEVILKPVSNLEAAIFGSSQKAGIVCTGGACRNVPASTGVETKVTASF